MQIELENDWQFVDKDYCRMKPIFDEKDDEEFVMLNEQNLVNELMNKKKKKKRSLHVFEEIITIGWLHGYWSNIHS